MKILHAPVNIAGQASAISHGLRKTGVISDVMVFQNNTFAYPVDIDLHFESKNFLKRSYLSLSNLLRSIHKYDLIHFHFGRSLLPYNLDLYLLKLIQIPTIMHYWGSDIIQTDIATDLMLYDKSKISEIFGFIDNSKQRRKIDIIKKLVNQTIVGDYSLLPFSPSSKVIRQAIEVDQIPFIGAPKGNSKTITILHAPTNRAIKGTGQIVSVIQDLQKNYELKLLLVEGKSHAEAMKFYQEADIVIDDILQGPYGLFAIECMALGKPVVAYVRNRADYPGLPIINANPSTLYAELEKLIRNQKKRIEIGQAGREFVIKNHESTAIAKQLKVLYDSLIK